MPKRLSLLLACAACLASPLTCGADDAAPQARIPTVTRWVKVFTELELSLASSVRGRDDAALQKILADDFELRTGAMPGTPTPRAEFIHQSLVTGDASFTIEQMAVHDLGDNAVVSFLQAARSGGKRVPARDIFVVDVWKRSGDDWRLAIRYAGPAGARDFVIPGAAAETPAIPKKY
jgi:ketosteroid isomerase-like protein